MKHKKKGRKLHRKHDQRRALFKSLAQTLFLKEKIQTTEAKAKETQRISETFITLAKRKNLHSQRLLRKFLSSKTVKKLLEEIAPRYIERKGGYTRIIKLGPRKSDGAKMAIIELIK